MAITFAPKRGHILMCDFDMAFVDPEMRKIRQALVVSIKDNNQLHALKPGTCTVVPFSTVQPTTMSPDDIFFRAGTYWSLSEDCWARCKMISTVSHHRLRLVLKNSRPHSTESLSSAHLDEVERGIMYALGL